MQSYIKDAAFVTDENYVQDITVNMAVAKFSEVAGAKADDTLREIYFKP